MARRPYSAAKTTAVSAEDALWDRVLTFLKPAEGRMARAFQRAVESARAGVAHDDVLRMIRAGDIEGAVSRMLGTDAADPSLFLGLRIAVAEAALETAAALTSGALRAQALPGPAGALLDTLAPSVVAAVRSATMSSVQDVTQASRAALRTILLDTMRQGLHPTESLHQMTEVLGLTPRDATAMQNYRRELATGSFAAARRTLTDQRLSVGKPLAPEEVDRRVEAYGARLLKHRAETVALTEASRAFNIGQHVAWAEMLRTGAREMGHLTRHWLVAPDERTCEACRDVVRRNPDGVGFLQPFQTVHGAYLLPPLHPRCRCIVVIRLNTEAAAFDIARGLLRG